MHSLRSLPFKRWDVPYEHGESGHSYCARLVIRQGNQSTLRQFAMYNNLDWQKLVPEQLLKVVLKLPLAEEIKSSLIRCTPVRRDGKRCLGDEQFAISEFTVKWRRWCPACITEKPYGRVWFDMLSIHMCPYHNTPLVDRDRTGAPAPWGWPDYAFSRHNVALGGPRLPNKLRIGELGHYILGRLHLESPLSAPILDGHPMSDVLSACEAIGSIIKYPTLGDEAPVWEPDFAELGFRPLSGSMADLAEFFRGYIAGAHPSGLAMLSHDRSLVKCQTRLRATCAFRPKIMRALKEALESQGRPPSVRITDAEVEEERIGFQTVSRRFGLNASACRRLAERLHLVSTDNSRFNRLLTSDALRVVDYAHSLISVREAATRLCVIKDAIDKLVDAGHLERFTQVFGRRTGPLFDPVQIDTLKVCIDDLPVTGRLARSCTFQAAIRKRLALPGKLAVDVMEGRVPVAGRQPGKGGFDALILDMDINNPRPMLNADPSVLNTAESAIELNIRSNTFECLLDAGVIKPKATASRLSVFDRDEVLALGDRYVRSSDFYTVMRMNRQVFKKLMLERGVKPLPKSSVSSDTLYVRAEVLAALNLEADPTVLTDADLGDFWEALTSEARARVPKLRFPARLYPGLTKAQTAARSCIISIRHDCVVRSLTIACEPSSEGFSLELALDDRNAWPGVIEKIVAFGEAREEKYRQSIRVRNDTAYQQEKAGS